MCSHDFLCICICSKPFSFCGLVTLTVARSRFPLGVHRAKFSAIFNEKIEIRERSFFPSFRLWIPKTVQRSALCRSWRELSNKYLLAKFGFDTAENEPYRFVSSSSREFEFEPGGLYPESGEWRFNAATMDG